MKNWEKTCANGFQATLLISSGFVQYIDTNHDFFLTLGSQDYKKIALVLVYKHKIPPPYLYSNRTNSYGYNFALIKK